VIFRWFGRHFLVVCTYHWPCLNQFSKRMLYKQFITFSLNVYYKNENMATFAIDIKLTSDLNLTVVHTVLTYVQLHHFRLSYKYNILWKLYNNIPKITKLYAKLWLILNELKKRIISLNAFLTPNCHWLTIQSQSKISPYLCR